MNQRGPGPDLPWVANVPQRARPRRLPLPPRPRRVPPLPRPHVVGQGRAPGDRGRARQPASRSSSPGRSASTPSRTYFDEMVKPLLGEDAEYLGETTPRLEGRPAPERARDALPDRLGGALRARDDRVHGLRHAGDRDALRRGAGGRRAWPQRDHRGRATARWRPPSRTPTASIRPSAARYVEEHFSAGADGLRLRGRVRAPARARRRMT